MITLAFSIKLYIIARQHAVQIEAQRQQFQVCKSDYKGAVTFCVVTGAFTLAWVPNLALRFYQSLHHEKHSVAPYFLFCVCLFMLCNSWWNVLIYYIRNSFRSAAKSILFGSHYRPDDSTASIDLAHGTNKTDDYPDNDEPLSLSQL